MTDQQQRIEAILNRTVYGKVVGITIKQMTISEATAAITTMLNEARVDGEYQLIRKVEKLTMKMDDHYGEFECLDDIEDLMRERAAHLTKQQANEGGDDA